MQYHELTVPFWIRPHKGADPEDILSLETQFGAPLPSDYKLALLESDGGVSTYSSFSASGRVVPIPSLLPVHHVLRAHRDAVSWGTPAGILVFASGAHDWMGFDYRAGPPPSIVYQTNEYEELEYVARSFGELLSGLVED